MSRGEYVHKAVDGIVMTIDDKQTDSGKYLVTARIQDDDGKIWLCTFWEQHARAFMGAGLLDQRAYVEGGLRDGNNVNVRFFDGKKSAPKRVERYVEPSVEVEEYDHKSIKTTWTDNRGMRTYRIEPKRMFIKVNGTWERKVDYCLRVMGPAEVMGWLREFRADGSPGGILVKASDYKEKLQIMIETCQQCTGDYLEYYEVAA